MKRTTLCYIEMDGKQLMLHRTKKENDENKDKYIGLGGHFLENETPEECMLREVNEESGIKLEDYTYRGIVHFHSDEFEDEDMYLFSGKAPLTSLPVCNEGDLCLIEKSRLLSLPMWAGDKIFLDLIFTGAPFFDLSLAYKGQDLVSATLDGKAILL